jgi:phenylalanyl-tRNA synthetase beta chain
MIISVNSLRQFTDINISIEELTALIGARLVEIEDVINLGDKYKNVLIVKVIEAEKLEGSDHLSVVKIDDGSIAENVERDENGLIQVVCGAPNIRSGQMVAWLPPKTIVPQTFDTDSPFVLDTRKLRGVVSNGMIASARELDLFDEHDGILELDVDVMPGSSFAEVYELNDYLLNIENKSLTHRPDCFGIIGFAREVAAVQGNTFITPEWLNNTSPDFAGISGGELGINVEIDDSKLSDRYTAICMSDVDMSRKSPLKFQTYLSRVGVRPINAVVDVTNYLMMLTGQPLHAFDYDKVLEVSDGRSDIHVRAGKEDEKLELLDGRIIELSSGDIVIAAGDKAIALAGAMGGAETEVDKNTRNIIIESATFNLYNLRATQMRHGIFSEAITRFTKGQPTELTAPVLAKAVRLMNEWSGAKRASEVAEAYPCKADRIDIEFSADIVNSILGTDFTEEGVIGVLQNVEFMIDKVGNGIKVTVPYWRADVHIVEDVVEEIGRLSGFDNINPTLPVRDFAAICPSSFDNFRSQVRNILARCGANEVLTYSFVHGDTLKKVGQELENSYRILNSISPDLQYYRQTLTPSLLGLVHPNIKQGYDSFALFEMNKTHSKLDGLDSDGVPFENNRIALVVAEKNKQAGAPYYKAKTIFDYLCKVLGVELDFRPFDADTNNPLFAPFELRRSARVFSKKTNTLIGVIGEYKKSVAKGFKLPEYVAGFDIDARALFEVHKTARGIYTPLSRYPISERDICFKADGETSYADIIRASKLALDKIKLEYSVSPVDIYQADGSDTKNVTIRVSLTSHDHTLTGDEVTTVVDSIINSVKSEINAAVI